MQISAMQRDYVGCVKVVSGVVRGSYAGPL